ncbi:hypothetical protein PUNSTDRAFT_110090 [Punctularia strigosozonata HHB-11173 SS5]|uniref:uncharacterized protein n=1 Tax=Punctularia strigosozonata (strain HHB-11173) TaxID=741275 RepID=UPI0004417C68|nr:uncharacterized protein PUNSTDRAFT_110090 [Punctularia strigosozonata HHB-11173 SS5]EIN13932.1 hypothetical protein PUNSTDRAFT_110090 [Punctularia strigosozonata HHB-11173 SS5]
MDPTRAASVPPPLVESPTAFVTSGSEGSSFFGKRQGSPVQLFDERRPQRQESHWDTPDRDWIPAFRSQHREHRRRRTLILCFDGTGDSFDDDNSNVVQLISMLKKDDANEQMVYYQTGIGTYSGNPLLALPLVQAISRTLDEMVAWNLGRHVKDGYEFLMNNYSAGDKICIFGFSRGAYTARALAGMLQKVGLLSAFNHQQLPFAYDMFKRDDDYGYKMSVYFKKTFSIPVKIDFVGVWDTVASVGVIPRYLPFASTNTAIRIFRHAIALDEHRVRFVPNFYHSDNASDPHIKHEPRRQSTSAHLEAEEINRSTGQVTDTKEVFFAGAHSDVGGGSVKNFTRHSLARISLRWMIRECFRTDTGIIFDAELLRDVLGMDVDRLRDGDMSEPQRISPNPKDPLQVIMASDESPGFWSALWDLCFGTIAAPLYIIWNIFSWLAGRPTIESANRAAAMVSRREPCVRSMKQKSYEGEAIEELHDALSPMYDQMDKKLFWQMMEWIPQKGKRQRDVVEENDVYVWILNKGRGRKIFRDIMKRKILVHQSVLTRLEALDEQGKPGSYIPRIRPNLHYKEARKDENRRGWTWWRHLLELFTTDVAEQLSHTQWMTGAGDWFHWETWHARSDDRINDD